MPKRSKQKPAATSQGKKAPEEPIPPQGLLRCKLDKNLEEMKTLQNVTEETARVFVPYDATTKSFFAEKLLPRKLEPEFLPLGIAGINSIEEAVMVATNKFIHGLVKIGPKTYLPFMKYDLAVNIKVAKGPIHLKSPANVAYVGGQPVIKNKKLETGEVWHMAKGSLAAFSNFDDVEKVLSYQVCFPRRVPKDSIQSFRLVTAKRLGREEDRTKRDTASSSTCSATEETFTEADDMVPILASKFKETCKVREVGQERRTVDDDATTDEIVASVENMRLAAAEPEIPQRSLPKTPHAANSREYQPSEAYRTPEPSLRTDERSQPSASGATKMKIRATKVIATSEQTVTEIIEIQSGTGTAVDIVTKEKDGPWHAHVRYGPNTRSTKRTHRPPSREEPEDPQSGAEPKSKRKKTPKLVVNRKKVRSNVLSRTTPRKLRPRLPESIVSGTTATDLVLGSSDMVISSSSSETTGLPQVRMDAKQGEDSFVGLQADEDSLLTSDESRD